MAAIEVVEAELGRPQHSAALVTLLSEYASDPMGGAADLEPYVKATLAVELQRRSNVHVVLAFVNDVPSGLVICIEGFSTFACKPLLNIHDVVVTAEQRGKGLFSRMLIKVEEIAVRLGCCKLTLEVLEGNHAATAVYAKAGFAGYELDPELGKAMFWQKKL
jgi:GNAT superfamily N-acetyltransferase